MTSNKQSFTTLEVISYLLGSGPDLIICFIFFLCEWNKWDLGSTFGSKNTSNSNFGRPKIEQRLIAF